MVPEGEAYLTVLSPPKIARNTAALVPNPFSIRRDAALALRQPVPPHHDHHLHHLILAVERLQT